MKTHLFTTGLSLILCLSLGSCGGDSKSSGAGGPKPASQPSGGAAAAAPSGDPTAEYRVLFTMDYGPKRKGRITDAEVALGRKLFEDKRLSKGNDMSCATCHDLDNWGQDGKATAPGTGGAAGPRNTPTVFNAHKQFAQFWDYRAETVEQQATMPMTGTGHGVKDEAELVRVIESDPEYVAAFQAVYKKDEKPVSEANVGMAIGAFVRKLETPSRWDKWLAGDDKALTAEEKKGLQAFVELTCTTCHIGQAVGGSMPQKLGLIKPVESKDLGRYEFTKQEGDKYMFKVPQLLNVEKTAPYYHDGSVATLEEAVEHMALHQIAMPATKEQLASIMVFMKALTGEKPAILK